MKHTEEWETCDQCGEKIEENKGSRAQVCRMKELSAPIINKNGAFCSEECVSKWLGTNIKVIYGHLNAEVWAGKH